MFINPHMNVIDRAAEVVGSRTKLAKIMGVSQSCITQWDRRKRIPAARVIEIEKITGISRHVLRPDIFGERA
jgi:DNA-binding transcriptional regulator YdaS (Cro superfamily)